MKTHKTEATATTFNEGRHLSPSRLGTAESGTKGLTRSRKSEKSNDGGRLRRLEQNIDQYWHENETLKQTGQVLKDLKRRDILLRKT